MSKIIAALDEMRAARRALHGMAGTSEAERAPLHARFDMAHYAIGDARAETPTEAAAKLRAALYCMSQSPQDADVILGQRDLLPPEWVDVHDPRGTSRAEAMVWETIVELEGMAAVPAGAEFDATKLVAALLIAGPICILLAGTALDFGVRGVAASLVIIAGMLVISALGFARAATNGDRR